VTGDTLVNISTRAHAETGNNVLIGGFIIGGSSSKAVIVRAIGPSLSAQGVSNALADPSLQLIDSNGILLGANDNWQTTELGGLITSDQVAAITASALAPSDPNESAILLSLNPGSYTALVTGTDDPQNIALVEVYDLDSTGDSQLLNISSRALLDTGDGVMIAGFVVGGTDDETLLLRGIGPSLTSVANPIPDPALSLYDANGDVVMQNNNWADTQEADISATGLAPSDALESAILVQLPPGSYTVILIDSTSTPGTGLVEVYNLTNNNQ